MALQTGMPVESSSSHGAHLSLHWAPPSPHEAHLRPNVAPPSPHEERLIPQGARQVLTRHVEDPMGHIR